ncbi:MAG TPA: LytR C-terminal domain-containing protein [Gaiellaceae bacterium]|nr:LytR C-terminal domain-containing protein [Gaiellaceae bacterium]
MEHALPTPPNHPWRTIAVVAAGIATLELLGLVIVGVALIAKPVMHRARAEATATPTKHQPTKTRIRPLLPRGSTSVTVLNGNGRAGAAAAQASRVRARGYLLGDVGNAPRMGYGRSVIMYRGGRRPEALRLARDLGIRLVTPLDGLRPRDLLGAQLAVVVGG